MHFIVPDFCNQNECLIKTTLQRLKYSTCPNGTTLCTEKSQTFKNDVNPFLSFVIHNDWLQIHRWLSVKSMKSNFVVVASVSLQICCHIVCGMPYLCIFDEEVVALLGQLLVNGCEHFLWSELEHEK